MKIATTFFLMFCLAGCARGPATRMVAAPSSAPQVASAERAPGTPARFIALSHKLRMLAPENQLQAQFQAIQAQCLALGCELLSVTSEAGSRHQPASASLVARVPPAAFDKFFADTQ